MLGAASDLGGPLRLSLEELRPIYQAITVVGCMAFATIDAAVLRLVCHSAGPVSYTHLDVYKRQS